MLSFETIKSIILANKMCGRLESGYRYWICDYYSLGFYHSQYRHWNEFKLLLERSEMSNSPIEDSQEKLTDRINELVEYLFNIQSK